MDSSEVKQLQESLNGLLTRAQEWFKKRHENNPYLSKMIESIDFTIQCLSHEESQTRLLALDVFDTFFPDIDIKPYRSLFERLAFLDPDLEIRKNAIAVLARIAGRHGPRTQKEIGKRIARVILEQSEEIDFRKVAYEALCTVSSDPDIRMRSCDPLRFPEDVDWSYVRSWE